MLKNNINKKNYISINAEMLGRALKVAQSNVETFRDGITGIHIWSSGHGINIMGTNNRAAIFFHDENGYFGEDFHYERLFFTHRICRQQKKFMRNLLKHDNQKKQVRIEEGADEEKLVRSTFFKQNIDNIFTFKLQKSNKANIKIVLNSAESKSGIHLDIIEDIFLKIPTKSTIPTVFDRRYIKLLDQIHLNQGKNSTKPQPVTIHFTDSNMLCGIRQHAFFLCSPLLIGEMTLSDAFESTKDNNENIFKKALSEKKYRQIYHDLREFFPDLGLGTNQIVYTRE